MRRLLEIGQGSRMGLAKDIGSALVTGTVLRFDEGVAPDGKPWKPSQSEKTLIDRARLRNSIRYKASPDYVVVGTNVKYAAIHQFGGVITPKKAKVLLFSVGGKKVGAKKVTIPARPFIGISEADIKEVEGIILDYLKGTLK